MHLASPVQPPTIQPNSPNSVAASVAQGSITWTGPLLLVCARTFSWMATQGVVALLFVAQHHPNPWREATYWFTLCGSFGDLLCLAGMRYFTRREGIRLRDLLGPIRMRWGRDLWLGLGYLALVAPGFVGGGWLAQRLFYGASNVNPGSYFLQVHPLPLWAVIYSAVVWWVIQSPTEELTYQGYCLPRLEALAGHRWGQRWIGAAIVALFFTGQHCALGFFPDGRYLLYRFLAFLPGCLIVIGIYLRTRRLAPLIVAHWPMDILVVAMTSF